MQGFSTGLLGAVLSYMRQGLSSGLLTSMAAMAHVAIPDHGAEEHAGSEASAESADSPSGELHFEQTKQTLGGALLDGVHGMLMFLHQVVERSCSRWQ
eukprot:CAMPEP_0202914326 /NCGR_PEP_ID=MMETSP1392-20130828/62831_1 /ASSEMBLY_ACC=CAM_ASM_000868 /TAXON_ID=225041 /ORGANISM="Chlamydomonas chlamydogama, Strain SAG 11-48b" /LENGTH=97 /DNA_ID=CAMNT_0049605939 /DNA_START=1 /DNA_END=291 /DNA_ORIENTATION=-